MAAPYGNCNAGKGITCTPESRSQGGGSKRAAAMKRSAQSKEDKSSMFAAKAIQKFVPKGTMNNADLPKTIKGYKEAYKKGSNSSRRSLDKLFGI